MAHSSPLAEGQILAGKYRVERSLGSGGMGLVLAAHHMQLGTGVAIKLLRPEACADVNTVARFVREARAAARLQSEHVARVVDVGTLETGAPYMVMELLHGSDLAHVLAAEGPLPIERAVLYVLEACEALAEAHALGIVHRDLKPANLFLARRPDGSPFVKVLDFGISKVLPTPDGAAAAATGPSTATGAVFGTPYYMSPEQVRSARSVDARSDVWSLGAVLYELLTGKRPFTAEALPAVFLAIATEPPEAPRNHRRDLPPALEAVVLACLEKDLARRVPSVGELARRLAPFAPAGAAALVERVQRLSRSGLAQQAPTTTGPADGSVQAATGKSWEGSTPTVPKSRAPLLVAIALGVTVLAVGSAMVIPRLRSERTMAGTLPLPPPPPSVASSPPEPAATLPPPHDEPSASAAAVSPSASASGAPSAKPTPTRRLPGVRPPRGKHDESSPTVE